MFEDSARIDGWLVEFAQETDFDGGLVRSGVDGFSVDAFR